MDLNAVSSRVYGALPMPLQRLVPSKEVCEAGLKHLSRLKEALASFFERPSLKQIKAVCQNDPVFVALLLLGTLYLMRKRPPTEPKIETIKRSDAQKVNRGNGQGTNNEGTPPLPKLKFIAIIYPNDDGYLGQTKDGKPHGFGKMIYANGHVHMGKFEDGKFLFGKQTFKSPSARSIEDLFTPDSFAVDPETAFGQYAQESSNPVTDQKSVDFVQAQPLAQSASTASKPAVTH